VALASRGARFPSGNRDGLNGFSQQGEKATLQIAEQQLGNIAAERNEDRSNYWVSITAG